MTGLIAESKSTVTGWKTRRTERPQDGTQLTRLDLATSKDVDSRLKQVSCRLPLNRLRASVRGRGPFLKVADFPGLTYQLRVDEHAGDAEMLDLSRGLSLGS